MNTKNIPQIRFKEFEGEWEEKKFSKITYSAGKKNKDNIPLESYSITNENGFIPQNEQFEKGGNMTTADKSMYYIVEKDSFAYNPARINVGSIGYYNGEKSVIISSLYEVFKTTTEINNRFLWHWLKSDHFHKKILQFQEGGVRLYFYYDKLCMCSIYLPTTKEQEKIGKLIDYLDKQISISEAKLDKLRTIKKTLLKKMFAAQGELTPQIRFKGFDGEWEENALNNWIEPSKEKNIENNYSKNDVLSVSGDYGVVNQIEFQGRSFAGASVSNYGVLHTNDIVYTKSPLKANPYGIIKTNMGQTGIVSTLYAIYRGKQDIDPIFVQHYFELDTRLNTYLRPLVRKGAKNDMKVSSEDAIKGNVNFPEKKEQTKISQLLLTFDKQILIQEQKIEKLKAVKKTLLKKMFV